jgi:hypothetical protein
MVVAMAAKTTAKGIDNNRTIYKTYAFCYKQATDIISLSPEQMMIIFKQHFKKRKSKVELARINTTYIILGI